jgi:hypothetical protein
VASTPRPGVDLSLHLAPIYDNPLLVNVADLARGGGAAGVAIFSIRQPFEEDFAVPRHLIVTPFTIMAVAPHPTRLGIGILKWDRSILSLRRLTSQTLFRVEHESPAFVGSLWRITATEHDVAPPPESKIDELQTNAPEAGEDGRATAPIVNAGPRVGRNDDCPCGSGKKYKKCCGGA